MNLLRMLKFVARRGDVVRFPLARPPTYLVSGPAFVRQVLAADEDGVEKGPGNDALAPLVGHGLFLSTGERWARRRRAVVRSMGRDRLEALAPFADRRAAALVDAWLKGGGTDDVYRDVKRAMIDVAAVLLAGAPAFVGAPDLHAALETAWDGCVSRAMPLPLSGPSASVSARATAEVRAAVAVSVDGLAANDDTSDRAARAVLAAMSDAVGDDGQRVFTRDDLVDEGTTFVLAGQECTALLVTWLLALLAAHPEARARAAREPAFLRAAIAETLRLYPPAWILSRTNTRPLQLGDDAIAAGATLLLSPALLHTDARFFDDPLAFRPERFLHGVPASAQGAYLPFGAGPRACIGSSFATMQATRFATALLSRGAPRARGALPPIDAGITLRPGGPIAIGVSALADDAKAVAL